MAREKIARKCSIENCDNGEKARQLCTRHYQQLRNTCELQKLVREVRACQAVGCDRTARYQVYCTLHYVRYKRSGDLYAERLALDELSWDEQQKQFWAKVEIGDANSCWEWQLSKSVGYGITFYKGATVKAHRMALFYATGIFPHPDLFVLHSCDNRGCCNPNHLREGTFHENLQEAIERNRIKKGSQHGSAKLSEEDIPIIRGLFAQGLSYPQIAKQYHMDRMSIKAIVTRKLWKHVE